MVTKSTYITEVFGMILVAWLTVAACHSCPGDTSNGDVRSYYNPSITVSTDSHLSNIEAGTTDISERSNLMNDNVSGLDETTIQLEGKVITLTRQDAQLLGAALLQRIQESDRDIQEILAPQTKHLEGWIDYDGQVRVGRWLLNTTFGRLAFVFRPPPGPATLSIQYVAPVRRTQEGWLVDPVYEMRIVPAR